MVYNLRTRYPLDKMLAWIILYWKQIKPAATLVANSCHDAVLCILKTKIYKIKTKKFINRITYEQLDADFKHQSLAGYTKRLTLIMQQR